MLKKINEVGIILTNKNGIIKWNNQEALEILNSKSVAGNSIKYYFDKISLLRGGSEETDDGVLYFFYGDAEGGIIQFLLEKIDVGIFFSDLHGEISFSNGKFKEIFDDDNKNIFSLFEKNGINIKSFKIIEMTGKDVSYELKIKDGMRFSVKFIPLSGKDGNLYGVYGFFVEKNNDDILKNKIVSMEREFNQYKASKGNRNAEDVIKPNIQFGGDTMKTIYSILYNISNKDITVLLLGQSGTGKSSIARIIHNESIRRFKPFVTINCASLAENLIESELFGYEKGAFTGALSEGKKGLIEIAEGGTVFIDEIGELPLYLQGKLLELVQERTYRPVGSNRVKRADVRIIVATNKDLYSLVENKKFREDLYYRVAVAVINIPPLSERMEDVKILIEAYALYFNKKYDLQVKFSKEVKEILEKYKWPGNIRELEHMIEFLIVRSERNMVEKSDLPLNIIDSYEETGIKYAGENFAQMLQSFEEGVAKEYYRLYKSSYRMAEALEISQSKASRLIRRYCK